MTLGLRWVVGVCIRITELYFQQLRICAIFNPLRSNTTQIDQFVIKRVEVTTWVIPFIAKSTNLWVSLLPVNTGDAEHKGQHHRGSVVGWDQWDHSVANVCRSN